MICIRVFAALAIPCLALAADYNPLEDGQNDEEYKARMEVGEALRNLDSNLLKLINSPSLQSYVQMMEKKGGNSGFNNLLRLDKKSRGQGLQPYMMRLDKRFDSNYGMLRLDRRSDKTASIGAKDIRDRNLIDKILSLNKRNYHNSLLRLD